MESASQWLTVEQVAAHLKVSKESVYRWLEAKKIPAHRLGRLWRFQQAEVDAWVMSGGGAEDDKQKNDNK